MLSKNFALLLLAAGLSSRFGSNKLLHLLNGKYLIESALSLSRFFGHSFVVCGNDYEALKEVIKAYSIEQIYNANYKHGINSSIRCGLCHINNQRPSMDVIILPCDMPLVDLNSLQELLHKWHSDSSNAITRPVPDKALKVDELLGFPVIFNNRYIADFLASRDCLEGFAKDKSERFVSSNKAFFSDIDTVHDLHKLTDSN